MRGTGKTTRQLKRLVGRSAYLVPHHEFGASLRDSPAWRDGIYRFTLDDIKHGKHRGMEFQSADIDHCMVIDKVDEMELWHQLLLQVRIPGGTIWTGFLDELAAVSMIVGDSVTRQQNRIIA